MDEAKINAHENIIEQNVYIRERERERGVIDWLQKEKLNLRLR